ncbi:MAG: PAS domain S-box protein, partial [Planctomycetota bacterium]
QGLIQETARRLQAIIQSSPQAIINMTTDGRVKNWNTAAERMFGWSEKDVAGKPLPIIPNEKQNEFHTLQSMTLQGASFTDKDAIRRRKDGSPINVSISAAPLYNANGDVEGIMELVTDITERKRNEEQIRKLLQAVEQSPATVLITDTNGSIEYVNPKFSQITGYTREEAIGKNPRVLKSGKTPPEEYKRLWETISAGGEWRGEFLNRKKNGGLYWESASISAVKNQQGVVTHFVAVKEDITNHVKAEEQVRLQLQRMSGLHEIDVAITGNLDLNHSLNVFLNKVTTLLAVDAADVLLFNAQRQRLEYADGYGFDTDAIRRSSLLPGEGTAGRAALEQGVVHVPDLGKAGDDFVRAKLLAEEGFVAYYAIPLITKEHVQGVLEIFHRKPLAPDKEWLEFLKILATQGAILVEHSLLFADLQRSNTELVMAYDRTIEGWSCALDMRDQETEGHTQRVVDLTLNLARAMGVGEEKLIHVRRGALLHDIGKIGVPDRILHKPGPLLAEEWVIMRQHPIYAFAMLSPISYLSQALDIPYCHHEKWDGSGYPRGLMGEQIPLLARIFAVVDVWDALRFDRPYRKGMTEAQALEYIISNAGTHFDPQAVEAFLQLERK